MSALRTAALVGAVVATCTSLSGCVMQTPVGVTRRDGAVAFVVKPCAAQRSIGSARIYTNPEATGRPIWSARLRRGASPQRELPVRDAVAGYRVNTRARVAYMWPRIAPTSTRVLTAVVDDQDGTWLDDPTFAPADARPGRVFSDGEWVSLHRWNTDLDACTSAPFVQMAVKSAIGGAVAFTVVLGIAITHTVVLRRRKRAADAATA